MTRLSSERKTGGHCWLAPFVLLATLFCVATVAVSCGATANVVLSAKEFPPRYPERLRIYQGKQLNLGEFRSETGDSNYFYGYGGKIYYFSKNYEIRNFFKKCFYDFLRDLGMQVGVSSSSALSVPRLDVTFTALSDTVFRFTATVVVNNRLAARKAFYVQGDPKYDVWSTETFKTNIYNMINAAITQILSDLRFRAAILKGP